MTFCGTDLTDHRLDTLRLIAEVAGGYEPEAPPEVTLRSMADVCRDMIDGQEVAPDRLESLLAFCTLLSERSLQEISSPGCGGGRRVGLGF